MDVSVIIPVGNRRDPVADLFSEYKLALDAFDLDYEVIVVLDGVSSRYEEGLIKGTPFGEKLRIVRLGRSFGEATAIMAGFEYALGRLVLTLPAYYQVFAEDLRLLLESKAENHMVVARRWPRRGNSFERLRRRVFHGLVRFVTLTRFRDLGCGARLMDREVLDEIHLYGDQHRFLPVVAGRQGFNVQEIDLRQSDRDQFTGSYGFRDYLRRMLDIITIFFLARFTKKPLRFFGTIGAIIFAVGASVLAFIVAQRILWDIALANRPALLLSTLFVVLGLQIFSLGLIGELIIFTHARSIKEYKIDKIIN